MRRFPLSQRSGFSLVEVMLALAVLTFGLGGAIDMYLVSRRGAALAHERLAAEMLAERKAQELKASGFAALRMYLEKNHGAAASRALYPAKPQTELLARVGEGSWQAELEQIEKAPGCIRANVWVEWRSLGSKEPRRVQERVHVFE